MTDTTGNNILEVIGKADRFNSWMYHTILPHVSGITLEIGSGIGNISKYFIRDGYEISLSDSDEHYIEILRHKFLHYPNVKDIIAIDLLHPQFEVCYSKYHSHFDSVFLLNVLEHVENDSQAIRNCKFLLKPSGRLTLLTPAYNQLFSKLDRALGHHRRYTAKSLRKVISITGMNYESSYYFNFLGILGWLYGKLRGFKTIPSGEMNVFNHIVPLGKILDRIFFRKAGLSVIATARKP